MTAHSTGDTPTVADVRKQMVAELDTVMAIAHVLGWFADDTELPEDIKVALTRIIQDARAHADSRPAAVDDIPPFRKDTLKEVLGLVRMEINRQDDLARAGKFGGTHILPGGPDGDRLKVLIEEVGEVAKELNEDIIEDGGRGRDGLFDELVQTAACAAAWACAVREGRPA